MLVAVDAVGYAIRWANRYIPEDAEAGETDIGDGFLPGPPIVSAGVVLYAPPGGQEVMAFSTVDGRRLWRRVCPQGAYLIAADGTRVWVGGRSVTCLSLSDGEPLWDRPLLSPPTGRAVLAGARILAPTLSHLVAIDTESGDTGHSIELPAGKPPLGNLLCLDHMLYSLQAGEVRAYPDVARLYPVVKKAWRDDPSDRKQALRLAWLELLQDRPERAFAVLEGLKEPPSDETETAELAHIRVETLLAMAGRPEAAQQAGRDVLALLEAAEDAAHEPYDRMRCTLAVAKQLAALDRTLDACRRLWNLGLDEVARRMIPLDHELTARAALPVADRLAELSADLAPDQQRTWRAEMEKTIRRLTADLQNPDTAVEAALRLRAAADVAPEETLAQQALLVLARWHRRGTRFAQAEQLFQEVRRREGSERLAAASAVLETNMDLQAYRDGYVPVTILQRRLAELRTKYADFAFDALRPVLGDEPPLDEMSGTVGQWAGTINVEPPVADTPAEPDARETRLRLHETLVWSIDVERQYDPPRLLHVGNDTTDVLGNRVLVLDSAQRLSCYRASDRDLLWRTGLRLPGRFPEDAPVRWLEGEDVVRRIAVEGQTVLISAREGIFAVESGTGRRLWVQPYDFGGHQPGPLRLESRLTIHDGRLVSILREGRLALVRVSDGTVLWERELLGEQVGEAWFAGDRLITVDPFRERVRVYDSYDGRLLHRFTFQQPDPSNFRIPLVQNGDLLCGPDRTEQGEGIRSVNVRTGKEVWWVPVDKPPVDLFQPGEGYVGAGLFGGDVWIIEAETGQVALKRHVSGVQGVVRAAMVRGTLVLHCYTGHGAMEEFLLAGMDIATDAELWRRDDVSPLGAEDLRLRIVGDAIPVVQTRSRTIRNRRAPLRMFMLDIRSGESRGAEVPLPETIRYSQINGDFLISRSGGVIVLGTEPGLYAYPITWVEPDETGGF